MKDERDLADYMDDEAGVEVEFEGGECPECGTKEPPTWFNSYENDDADGNRGEWLTFYKCRKCGYTE